MNCFDITLSKLISITIVNVSPYFNLKHDLLPKYDRFTALIVVEKSQYVMFPTFPLKLTLSDQAAAFFSQC